METINKKIKDEDILAGFFGLVSKDMPHEILKDKDGNILLDDYEQRILTLSFLCGLLDKNNLNQLKPKLIGMFIVENKEQHGDLKYTDDLTVEIAIIISIINRINKFFAEIPEDISNLTNKWFLFDKKLNTIQKIIVISWYIENIKIIEKLIYNHLLER
ncbi:MAG: hypothetical protein JJE53_02425 [Candidatus Pacebacteria bacterium]|nr:hypothetical protein [Candidatus Paceibacterota bacterium]